DVGVGFDLQFCENIQADADEHEAERDKQQSLLQREPQQESDQTVLLSQSSSVKAIISSAKATLTRIGRVAGFHLQGGVFNPELFMQFVGCPGQQLIVTDSLRHH